MRQTPRGLAARDIGEQAMRKVIVYNVISLDGYHTGLGNDVSVMFPMMAGKPDVTIRLREGRIVSVRPKSATAPLLALACSIKRSRPGSARPDCDRRYPLLTVCGRAALASARYSSSVSRSRLVLAAGRGQRASGAFS